MKIVVEKLTLYTETETLEFDTRIELAKYLGIKSHDRKSLLRRCKQMDYEIDFPLKKNEYPLK